jgi:hypothetical protein
LDDTQIRQLDENVKKAKRDLKESIWRTYKCLMLLAKDNTLKKVDMGLVHSSAAPDLVTFVLNRLSQDGDIEKGISPQFLVRNWPAMKEWPTKSVRDAFFASPKFPRLLNPDAVREAIQRGVGNGLLAYVGKAGSGEYKPFFFNQGIMTGDIEFSDEMFIITKEAAEAYRKARATEPTSGQRPPEAEQPKPLQPEPGASSKPPEKPADQPEQLTFNGLTWTGEIPPQKWMNFYTKVLAKFASGQGLKLKLNVEVKPDGGISKQRLEETKAALRELGLDDELTSL